MSGTSRINKTQRLSHKDRSIQIAMKKGIHIQLAERPTKRDRQRNNNANRSRLDHKIEGLIKIYTRLLKELFGNKTSFVSFNRTIRISFKLKHPLATNNVLLRRRWNKNPSLIFKESVKFNSHECMPFREPNSLGVVIIWDRRISQ